MTQLPSPTRDPDVLEADLDRHGYCIAEDALDAGLLARAREVVDERSRAPRPTGRPATDVDEWAIREGDRWVLLIAGECGLDDLVAHPLALGLARHLLGRRVLLSGFTAHAVHPGNAAMALHTDQWWLPKPTLPGDDPFRPGDIARSVRCFGCPEPSRRPINPAVVVNAMWALTDFTAGNGCTRVVPGSHLSGVEPDPAAVWDTVDAEVPAGGAVVWDARTWHASGRNASDAARIGISATYCGAQFRQLQNHALALRPTAFAGLSDEMRELLGFRLFSSYGATDDDKAMYARPGYLRA